MAEKYLVINCAAGADFDTPPSEGLISASLPCNKFERGGYVKGSEKVADLAPAGDLEGFVCRSFGCKNCAPAT